MALYDSSKYKRQAENKKQYELMIESLREDISNAGILEHINYLAQEHDEMKKELSEYRSALTNLGSLLGKFIPYKAPTRYGG